MMCLNWFCFCVYCKGRRGYSTIGGHSRSSVDIMSEKSSSQLEFDTFESCSVDEKNEKTTAMVSQAEIWQEDKKFTVSYISLFFTSIQTEHKSFMIDSICFRCIKL